jgi:hypothetical protein
VTSTPRASVGEVSAAVLAMENGEVAAENGDVAADAPPAAAARGDVGEKALWVVVEAMGDVNEALAGVTPPPPTAVGEVSEDFGESGAGVMMDRAAAAAVAAAVGEEGKEGEAAVEMTGWPSCSPCLKQAPVHMSQDRSRKKPKTKPREHTHTHTHTHKSSSRHPLNTQPSKSNPRTNKSRVVRVLAVGSIHPSFTTLSVLLTAVNKAAVDSEEVRTVGRRAEEEVMAESSVRALVLPLEGLWSPRSAEGGGCTVMVGRFVRTATAIRVLGEAVMIRGVVADAATKAACAVADVGRNASRVEADVDEGVLLPTPRPPRPATAVTAR